MKAEVQPKSGSKMIVCLLNQCLRLTDSKMHTHIASRQLERERVLYLLLCIGGEHKQRVDRQFATELGFPVHVISVADVPRLASAMRGNTDKEIVCQNTPEMRRASSLLAKALGTSNIATFDDSIALDRHKLEFSPVYSVFNRRAKTCFRKPDDALWTAI